MVEVRVLHEVWGMGIGGIETFLMGTARRLRPRGFRMDYLIHSEEPGHHEPEILSLGGRIFRCAEFSAHPARFAAYLTALRAAFRDGGPYDIFHGHYDVSGPALFAAAGARVPVRIVHGHSAAPELRFRPRWQRALLRPLTQGALERYATHGVAVSEPAAVSRFGSRWREDPRWRVTRSGIDLEPLRAPVDRARWRAEAGIPPDARVIVHIGRFGPEKNHALLIAMAAEMKRRGVPFRLVLLGDGWARKRLEEKARALGVGGEVMFLGYRLDVPRWLRGAAELLVFPSFYEGLPQSVIQAQAAGVPVLMSDRITVEAAVIPELVRHFPLEAEPSSWVDEALALLGRRDFPSAASAWERVAASPFNIERAVDAVEDFYRRALLSNR